jgi:hypothetical protein
MEKKIRNIQLLLASNKKFVFEYFVVFVLIIYAGNATAFTGALENMDNPVGFLLPISLVAILGFLKKVSFNYKFILILIGFTFHFIATTLVFGQLHPRFFLIYLMRFLMVYTIISSLGILFFRLYEDIMYYLSIIGLTLWIIIIIIPNPTIEILRNFQFSGPKTENSIMDFNVIVYTVLNAKEMTEKVIDLGIFRIFRNPGFAWEPGVFASLISIAMFSNLLRTKFKLKNNKHLLVFFAALASTFSTTGYSLAIFLLFFYIYNQNFINVFWLTPIFAVIAISLFALPFMSEKITNTLDISNYHTEEMIYLSAKYNIQYIPQRFESFYIDFQDFLNNPIIGYGGHLEAKWTSQLGAQIWTVSGLGKILAQFGIVGTVFFLFSLWVSSKRITYLFDVRGAIFPALFILLYAVSYSVFSTLIMSIWLFFLSNTTKSEILKKIGIHRYLKTATY